MSSVVLTCLLLPGLQDRAAAGAGAEAEAGAGGSVLDAVFFAQSVLDALRCSTGDFVSIESEGGAPGPCIILRARALDAQTALELELDTESVPYFVSACSSLYLSHARLHRVSRVSSPQSVLAPVKTLTLARVAGQSYPLSKEAEDRMLCGWFSTASACSGSRSGSSGSKGARDRVVRPGDVTPVPVPPPLLVPDSSLHHLPADHRLQVTACSTGYCLSPEQVCWYYVVAVELEPAVGNVVTTTGAASAATVTVTATEERDGPARFFVCRQGSTSVLLNECHETPPRLLHKEWYVAASILNSGDGGGSGGMRVLPPFIIEGSRKLLQSNNAYVIQTAPSNALLGHLRWATPLLRPPSSTPGLYSTAGAYGAAVIQTMAACDILEDLARFAQQQRVQMYHIDYRHFLYAAYEALSKKSKSSSSSIDPSLFSPSDLHSHAHSTLVPPSSHLLALASRALDSKLDVSSVLAAITPCVLCVTGLEGAVNTEPTLAGKIKAQADQRLCAFVHSLFSHLSVAASQNDGRGAEGGIILVSTTASPLHQLSPAVLEHFPQHLTDALVTTTTTTTVGRGAPSVSGMGEAGGQKKESEQELEREAVAVLRSACVAQAELLGRKHMTQFVQEVRIACLQREHRDSWEANAFGSRSTSQAKAQHSMLENRRYCNKTSTSSLTGISGDDVARVQASSRQSGRWGVKQHDGQGGELEGVSMGRVHWGDIGGVERVRDELIDTLLLANMSSTGHREVLSSAKRPRRTGVLLYGPPGTGKTLIAKAVATECGMAFMSVKGPELLDMYIGESERQVRVLFEQARSRQPCVLFFDELDSLAPARGQAAGGGAGGVLDRVVSQLLIEMDNLGNLESQSSSVTGDDNGAESGGTGVFVIGATNRPDLLDTALLRPGRFDKKIFLGPCESREGKIKILSAQTKRYRVQQRVSTLELVADLLSGQPVTGAELGAIVSTAYEYALDRKIHELEELSLSAPLEWREEGGARARVGANDSGAPGGDTNGSNSNSSSSSSSGSNCSFAEELRYVDESKSHVSAMRRVSEFIDDMESDDEALSVEITFTDFQEAVQNTTLSLSAYDYANYS